MKTAIVGLLLITCLALTACMAPQTRDWRLHYSSNATSDVSASMASTSATVEIKTVPFFSSQTPLSAEASSSAALAMMLAATNVDITGDERYRLLATQPSTPTREDSATTIANIIRQHERVVYALSPTLPAIFSAVDQGLPVLVAMHRAPAIFSPIEYAVVIGVDYAHETLWVRSGRMERHAMTFASFERAWARASYWAVLVIDPSRIPESLDPKPVIRELAFLESQGHVAAAQSGFSRALLNWPEQKTAWLGLASTSFSLGEEARAESVLRELVRRQPQYGAGLNNLADLLNRLGRPAEALPFAERAVSYWDIPQTRATLQAIRQRLEVTGIEATENAANAAETSSALPSEIKPEPAPVEALTTP